MTVPAIIIGILLSTFYGVIFHLVTGGNFFKLLLDIFLSWSGFWIGHFLAGQPGWVFLSIGPLRFGLATLSSLIFMLVGYWMSLIPKKPEGTG
jgi:hypothetical protein